MSELARDVIDTFKITTQVQVFKDVYPNALQSTENRS